MPNAMPPDVRQTLTEILSVKFAQYLETSVREYFNNPTSADARDVMLTAVAHAVRQVTATDPTARATVRAFALELLETE